MEYAWTNWLTIVQATISLQASAQKKVRSLGNAALGQKNLNDDNIFFYIFTPKNMWLYMSKIVDLKQVK